MRALFLRTTACLVLGTSTTAALADVDADETLNAKFQTTYIWQAKPAFAAPYSGPNSLVPNRETGHSFTATAAFGWRAWDGGELYLDAESAQGHPMSHLAGMGGLSNGELQKSGSGEISLYRARTFLRQSWSLGDGREEVASAMNQLGGSRPADRLTLTVGNLAVSDLFDNSAYAHDARSQFLNWSLLSHGAYDFAADVRGYTWGAALEWVQGDWALRAGRFAVPVISNGRALDFGLLHHHGDQLELERGYTVFGLAGRLRLLGFRNVETLADYDETLAATPVSTLPDIALHRRLHRKPGGGVNLEQAFGATWGGFLRIGAADGQTEPYSFASIDRSASTGAAVQGRDWGRADDKVEVAVAINGLSAAHRRYLAAGGSDAFLGDGRLAYRPEATVEANYVWAIARSLWLTTDWQHTAHPGYNADRGPVTTYAVRLHAEL